jgi:hypothetical protein
MVQESLYRESTLVATSQVHGDFLSKTRVKVIARVTTGEEGYAEPSIRVLNQWDNADAQTRNRPDYQVGESWINLSTNAAMEADLYNEIQTELGKNNRYVGKAWQPVQNDEKESQSSVKTVPQAVPLMPYEE